MFVDLENDSWARTFMRLTSLFALPIETGEIEDETIFDRLVLLANNFIDGVLSIAGLKVDRVEMAEELYVDDVFLTQWLPSLLEQSSESPVENSNGHNNSGDESQFENDSEPDRSLLKKRELILVKQLRKRIQ